jgi:hypothetical protein
LRRVLAARGNGPAFIEREVAAMAEFVVAKTSNRSVVGTMNEFAFEARVYCKLGDAAPGRLGNSPRGEAVQRDWVQQSGTAAEGDHVERGTLTFNTIGTPHSCCRQRGNRGPAHVRSIVPGG